MKDKIMITKKSRQNNDNNKDIKSIIGNGDKK